MTQFVIANNVDTQLATALPSSGAGSTTVTLASSANLPVLSAGQVMPLTLNDAATGLIYEVVYVTAISGVTLTVLRAQEGTGAQNWNIGDFAFCAPTQGTVAVTTGNPNNTFLVAPATASQHAVQFGQVAGVVGSVRNLVSIVTTAGSTKTVTADEVIVESALGGLRYCLSSLNLTGNLATQMDTGSAPASGFVAEYLIYNPNAAISGTNPRLLYTNAATKQGNVYGGANMPIGYTASALVGVWPTNPSSQFVVGVQMDRYFTGPVVTVLTSSTGVTVTTALSIASAVPVNARSVSGLQQIGSTTNSVTTSTLLVSSAGGGNVTLSANTAGADAIIAQFGKLLLSVAQTVYYTAAPTAGTMTYVLQITGYEF